MRGGLLSKKRNESELIELHVVGVSNKNKREDASKFEDTNHARARNNDQPHHLARVLPLATDHMAKVILKTLFLKKKLILKLLKFAPLLFCVF